MSHNHREAVDAAIADVDFDAADYVVCLNTNHGAINVRLWPEVAPNHCKNLIGLARIGFYDGIPFHRIISGFVVQVGCPHGNGTGGPGYTIDAEFNDRPHELGTLSMARTDDPNSAGSQFFICLGRVPHLDGSYTAFGEVADKAGTKVALEIGALPTDSADRPTDPAFIETTEVHVKQKRS